MSVDYISVPIIQNTVIMTFKMFINDNYTLLYVASSPVPYFRLEMYVKRKARALVE